MTDLQETKRHIVAVDDDKARLARDLFKLRGDNPRRSYDLVEVRWADPPIRTAHRWALVRYDRSPEAP